jgi:release factor glutamine methyltransferase
MAVKIQTIKDIRIYLKKELKDVYQEPEIRVLADILIKAVTGIRKLHLLHDGEYALTDAEAEKLIKFTDELITGKPIQYVVGETTFYNCMIKVSNFTLIPRPETEELVDLIIRENKIYNGNIIDFGSGSGCISIALAVNIPDSVVTGVEISEEAIRLARENAVLNNAEVSFIKGDIFTMAPEEICKAGIIVSNPPYIRISEKQLMRKNVLDFEPHQALFVTDSDPLVYYKAILNLAKDILLPEGRVYFEINEAMGRPLIQLFETFNYYDIEIVNDINGKERIIKGRKNG